MHVARVMRCAASGHCHARRVRHRSRRARAERHRSRNRDRLCVQPRHQRRSGHHRGIDARNAHQRRRAVHHPERATRYRHGSRAAHRLRARRSTRDRHRERDRRRRLQRSSPSARTLSEVVVVGYGTTAARTSAARSRPSRRADIANTPARRRRRCAAGQGARRSGHAERRQSRQRHLRPRARTRVDQRRQPAAVRRRRRSDPPGELHAARPGRTGRHRRHRHQSRRDRDDRHPQGRRRGRDLRIARLERRRA